MEERKIARALEEIAARGVPSTGDPWPGLRARIEHGEYAHPNGLPGSELGIIGPATERSVARGFGHRLAAVGLAGLTLLVVIAAALLLSRYGQPGNEALSGGHRHGQDAVSPSSTPRHRPHNVQATANITPPGTRASSHAIAVSARGPIAVPGLYVTRIEDDVDAAGETRDLVRLDPISLRASSPVLGLTIPWSFGPSSVNTQYLASKDGSTVAVVVYQPILQLPGSTLIEVLDARTGQQRARFYSPVPVQVYGLSPDGTRIYGTAPPETSSCGVSRKSYVLDASTGRVITSARISLPMCEGALYDASDRLAYIVQQPDIAGQRGASPNPTIVKYDLATGRAVGSVRLDGIRAGAWPTNEVAHGMPVYEQNQPAYALSPDGTRLAVLDGRTSTLTLIDTRTMRAIHTRAITRPRSLLERLGLAPETAEAKELVRGVSLGAVFLPDGRAVYVTGERISSIAQVPNNVHGLGVRLVDVDTGEVLAQGMRGRDVSLVGILPGRGVYVTVSPGSSDASTQATLYRLDPRTLGIEATTRYDESGRIVLLGGTSAPDGSGP